MKEQISLRKYCFDRNIRQKEFAQKHGLSEVIVSNIINGKTKKPKKATIEILEKATNGLVGENSPYGIHVFDKESDYQFRNHKDEKKRLSIQFQTKEHAIDILVDKIKELENKLEQKEKEVENICATY